VFHRWTMQGAYLRALARGEMRRNLDGSEAGLPDESARQHAQKILDERVARRIERARQDQERKRALAEAKQGEPFEPTSVPSLQDH
jgi:sRNA-binding protein